MSGFPNQVGYACAQCGQMAIGHPPHWNDPCPLLLETNEQERRRRDAANHAYIAMLDAQRMSYLRSGVAVEGIGDLFRKLAGEDDAQ